MKGFIYLFLTSVVQGWERRIPGLEPSVCWCYTNHHAGFLAWWIAFSFFEFSVTFSSSFSSCVSSLLPANLFLLGPDHLNHSAFFLAKTILASRCNWRNFLQLLQKPLFTVSMASKTSLDGFVRFQKRKIRVNFEPGPFIPREWAHRGHRCYL